LATTPQTKPLIFRKGLDMKEAVAGELAAAYHSGIVDDVRANDFQYHAGRLTVHLAREFGFCYGVGRAVD
jgi:4-hydroxy-3-methylbut-2-enyl diphosphate reductase